MAPERLEQLVAPVALYPDEILALVLPASTQPLQMVSAQRLLEQRKSDTSVQPPKSWDPSVVALLNYPEVVSLMNADVIWMQQLGTSVIAQQSAVMDAIQSFRKKAHDAGNLKSDDKQTVQVENQTIVVEPANPEVIYVPSYNPTTVVYPPQADYPPPYYYPYPPYPPYYSPGAPFFTGLIFGVALGYALNWGDHGIYHGDININNSTNISRGDNTNINRPDRGDRGDRGNRVNHHRENQWKPDRNSVARDQARLGAGGGGRPSAGQLPANRGGQQASLGGQGGRPSAGQLPADRGGAGNFQGGRGSSQFGSAQTRSGAFSGARDGAAANRYGARGGQSMRSSGMGSRGGGAGMSASRGGGGAARGGGGRGGRR